MSNPYADLRPYGLLVITFILCTYLIFFVIQVQRG